MVRHARANERQLASVPISRRERSKPHDVAHPHCDVSSSRSTLPVTRGAPECCALSAVAGRGGWTGGGLGCGPAARLTTCGPGADLGWAFSSSWSTLLLTPRHVRVTADTVTEFATDAVNLAVCTPPTTSIRIPSEVDRITWS